MMYMNKRTLSAWIRLWGYEWTGDEVMTKGFISDSEARELINQFVQEGKLVKVDR